MKISSDIKVFDNVEDFTSYRDNYNKDSSGISEVVYIRPCRDGLYAIYEIRFNNGEIQTCIVAGVL